MTKADIFYLTSTIAIIATDHYAPAVTTLTVASLCALCAAVIEQIRAKKFEARAFAAEAALARVEAEILATSTQTPPLTVKSILAKYQASLKRKIESEGE